MTGLFCFQSRRQWTHYAGIPCRWFCIAPVSTKSAPIKPWSRKCSSCVMHGCWGSDALVRGWANEFVPIPECCTHSLAATRFGKRAKTWLLLAIMVVTSRCIRPVYLETWTHRSCVPVFSLEINFFIAVTFPLLTRSYSSFSAIPVTWWSFAGNFLLYLACVH